MLQVDGGGGCNVISKPGWKFDSCGPSGVSWLPACAWVASVMRLSRACVCVRFLLFCRTLPVFAGLLWPPEGSSDSLVSDLAASSSTS